MSNEMTIEKAMEYFAGGLDCSQVVFEYGAGFAGLDSETALRTASAFGGGMFRGETCGCVTGALMAIGYRYGQYKLGDQAAKDEMLQKKAEFERQFTDAAGSLICKEILKHDISKPEEMQRVLDEGLLMSLCPQLACTACDILDELL